MNCASRKSGTNIGAAEWGEQHGKTRLDFMPGVRQQNTPANTVRYRTDTLSTVLSQVQERVIDQCKTANGIGYQRARRLDAEPITQEPVLMLSAFSCLYRFIICPAGEKKKPPWADHSPCSKAGHGGIREVSPCPFSFSIRLICQKKPVRTMGTVRQRMRNMAVHK